MSINSLPLYSLNCRRKISAVFFLSLFSMLMMHRVLPHVHHSHSNADYAFTSTDHHHHHESDYHHHDDDKEEDVDFDFLGFLLGGHSHSTDVNTLPTEKNIVTQKAIGKCFSFEITFVIGTDFLLYDNAKTYFLSYAPPDFNEGIYLSNIQLRGPPVLG